jgi:hypothetical protein
MIPLLIGWMAAVCRENRIVGLVEELIFSNYSKKGSFQPTPQQHYTVEIPLRMPLEAPLSNFTKNQT